MGVTRRRFLWVMLFYHNIFKLETQGHGRLSTWGNLAGYSLSQGLNSCLLRPTPELSMVLHPPLVFSISHLPHTQDSALKWNQSIPTTSKTMALSLSLTAFLQNPNVCNLFYLNATIQESSLWDTVYNANIRSKHGS